MTILAGKLQVFGTRTFQFLSDCVLFLLFIKPKWFNFEGLCHQSRARSYFSLVGLMACVIAIAFHIGVAFFVGSREFNAIEVAILAMMASMLLSLPLIFFLVVSSLNYLFLCNLFCSFILFLSFNWIFLSVTGSDGSPFAFNAVCMTWFSMSSGYLLFNYYVKDRK